MKPMKPVLFNTEMVRANLEDRKNTTRRIANINTDIPCHGSEDHSFVWDNFAGGEVTGFVCKRCGFGVSPPRGRYPCGTSVFRPSYFPGDILYVREAWQKYRIRKPLKAVPDDFNATQYLYRADGEVANSDHTPVKWRPSIHMPKEAARLFLRVTRVRVERLQDISADECAMEGVWPLYSGPIGGREAYYKNAFAKLWDSTIKKADLPTCGWDANPWVFVIKYERISKEEATKC